MSLGPQNTRIIILINGLISVDWMIDIYIRYETYNSEFVLLYRLTFVIDRLFTDLRMQWLLGQLSTLTHMMLNCKYKLTLAVNKYFCY